MTTTTPLNLGGAIVDDRYRIVERLGTGSSGTVYVAHDRVERRDVALKVFHSERLLVGDLEQIQGEFRILTSIIHPRIASAYDFGYLRDSGVPYYTREYVPGLPLAAGPPDDADALTFLQPILDLLDALDCLHRHGIVHRDIHAGNLIVCDRRGPSGTLIDFGLPRLKEASRPSSPRWLQQLPRDLHGSADWTPRSDLFLVGRLLSYRLTGSVRRSTRLPDDLAGWGPSVTLSLERIVVKATQPEPSRRFRSAAEFREALSQATGLGEAEVGESGQPGSGALTHETVGRTNELASIEEGLRTLASDQPAVVWITGERGAGRSHLLKEARLRAQLRGFETISVRGPQEDADSAVVSAMRSHAGRVPYWTRPLDPRNGGTPEERTARAAQTYFAHPGSPLVLLVDDVDQCSSTDLLLTSALARECIRQREVSLEGRGMLLVVAGSQAPAGLAAVEQHLRPLRAADAKRLFTQFLCPLTAPVRLIRLAVSRAEGRPLHLYQLAVALKSEWKRSQRLPEAAELPELSEATPSGLGHIWPHLTPDERDLVGALAVVERGLTPSELAVALDNDPRDVEERIAGLHAQEIVRQSRDRDRRCRLAGLGKAFVSELASRIPSAQRRRIHERVVAHLSSRAELTPAEKEHLARHLLAIGRRQRVFQATRDAVVALRAAGSFDRALRLLEDVVGTSLDRRKKLSLCELASSISEESGDHARGIALLEPFLSDRSVDGRSRVRLLRRLGIHYHRSGKLKKAKSVFRELESVASPRRDIKDLIRVDSELAELHVFAGAYGRAEAACLRGLDRLRQRRRRDSFRTRMEVMLRASLGHLEIRRLRPDRAARELKAAASASGRYSSTADQAAVLQNLAIAENLLNRFAAAKRAFRRAELLLVRIGERRELVKTSTNLAVIEAKLGNADAARDHLETAAKLVLQFPGARLTYFVAYSRGVASLLLGDISTATASLEEALPLGRALGDKHLNSFASVHLAESYLLAGRYRRALQLLRTVLRGLESGGPKEVERMAHARLLALAALLRRPRLAARSRRRLQEIEPTSLIMLERWNDLFVALAAALNGEDATTLLDEAREFFSSVQVRPGERFADVLHLACTLERGDVEAGKRLVERLNTLPPPRHGLLQIAEPLVRARLALRQPDTQSVTQLTDAATAALVGSPFLELDWQVECLKARLAVRRKDIRETRSCLHRAVHVRDLLLELVPEKHRETYLGHRRFQELDELVGRYLERNIVEVVDPPDAGDRGFGDIVGQCSSMVRLYRAIETLADQRVPVLIHGETGTGKELVARALHERSSRRDAPFFALHCASMSADLAESELFGHESGAFTGANGERSGILETIDGGTLLLDEVAQLPLATQPKLARFLDSGVFRRLGGTSERQVDVRIVAATSVSLKEGVEGGTFRPELFFRLRATDIHVPPLRHRGKDVQLLVRHFLELHAASLGREAPILQSDAIALLENHSWPGNVRELEGVAMRILLRGSPVPSGSLLSAEAIAGTLSEDSPRTYNPARFHNRSLAELKQELEREYLIELFRHTHGDMEKMMRDLGVKKSQLYAWFRRLGIDIRAQRGEL